ncbi:hypothetical protein ACJW31_11G157300 [Castanea mollissima]
MKSQYVLQLLPFRPVILVSGYSQIQIFYILIFQLFSIVVSERIILEKIKFIMSRTSISRVHSHFGVYWHSGNTISVSKILYLFLTFLKCHLKYVNLKRFKFPIFLFQHLWHKY